MNTYQVLKVIEDITSRDYVVKSWMVDDILTELMPLFKSEFEDRYAAEVWEEAAKEGYDEGFEEGKETANYDINEVINDMIKSGEYDRETLKAVRAWV
jgi:uncharacterized protein YfeS